MNGFVKSRAHELDQRVLSNPDIGTVQGLFKSSEPSQSRPADRGGFPVLPELRDLGEPARQAFAAACSRKVVNNNEVIYLQEEEATHLYFVASGHVRLSYIMEDGSAVLNAILPRGRWFGEMAALDGATHCEMATSIGASVVHSVSIRSFRALSERFPELNRILAHVVAHRYRAYVELARALCLKTLAARLAQALLRVADGLGTRGKFEGCDVPVIGPVVTQADLGLMARGARGNINRALKQWEAQGWIALRDRAIYVLDRESLEALSFEDEFE